MTREQIEKAVYQGLLLLRLPQWTVYIDWGGATDPDAYAETTATPGRHYAKMVFNEGLLEIEEDKINHTIVHELVHLHTIDILYTLECLISRVSEDTRKAIIETVNHQLEIATDDIATAFSDQIDLFDLIEEDK